MTTLTTFAVIQAVDNLTGPLRRMAGTVGAMAGVWGATGRSMQDAGRRMVYGTTLPIAMGLAAVVAQAKEFAKLDLGTQLAQVEGTGGRGFDEIAAQWKSIQDSAAQIRRDVMAFSEELGVSATDLMGASEAIVKMGIAPALASRYSRTAALMHMADPEFSTTDAAEFMGVIGRAFKFSADPTEHTRQLNIAADQITMAANKSRLSLGSLQEGLRQFAPLAATLGMTVPKSAAMLATAVNQGFDAVEVGTMLKSTLLRAVMPTNKAQGIYAGLGIDRSKYVDFAAAMPQKVVQLLAGQFAGQLDKKERNSLTEMLVKARGEGKMNDPAFIDRYMKFLTKAIPSAVYGDLENLQDAAVNALNAGGGKVDLMGLLEDMKGKGGTVADFATAFEGRHIARLLALLEHLDEYKALLSQLEKANGSVLGQTKQMRDQNLYGKLEKLSAAWERFSIKLAQSPVIDVLIEQLERLGNALGSISPAAMRFGTNLAVAVAAVGPLTWALGSLVRVAGLAYGAVRVLGASSAALAGLRTALGSGEGIAAALARIGASFSLLRVVARGSAIVAGVILLYENLDKLQAFAEGFSSSWNAAWGGVQQGEGFKQFVAETNRLLAEIQPAITAYNTAMNAWKQFVNMSLGIDKNATAIQTYFAAGAAAARGLAAAVEEAVGALGRLIALYNQFVGFEKSAWGKIGEMVGPAPGAPARYTGGRYSPVQPMQSSTPMTGPQITSIKGPVQVQGQVGLTGPVPIQASGQINVNVTGHVDGAATTVTAGGSLGGDTAGVKLRTGTSSAGGDPGQKGAY